MQKTRLSLAELPLILIYSIISNGNKNLRLPLFTPTFSGRQLGRKTRSTPSSERKSGGRDTNFPAKNRIWTFRSSIHHLTQRDVTKSFDV
jgi:hypothetical protein